MAKFVGYVVLTFALIALRAYTISMNWHWFIVPLGAPEVGIFHALGISGFVAMLVLTPKSVTNTDGFSGEEILEDYNKNLNFSFILSLLTLGFGYLYHCFM